MGEHDFFPPKKGWLQTLKVQQSDPCGTAIPMAISGLSKVISAAALRVDFILRLDNSEEELKSWERSVTELFTENQLSKQSYSRVNVFVNAQRSQDD